MASAFLLNRHDKSQVNHKNGNKYDNNIKNLEWVAGRENVLHSINILGNSRTGENNGRNKLSEQSVLVIRELLISTNLRHKDIGKIFNVSRYTITDINRGKNWKHVDSGLPIAVGFC